MRVTKYRPFRTTSTLDKVFDSFFGTQLSEFVGGEFNSSTPSANISETKDGYEIALALPGLSKEDVSIEVVDNTLIVKGSKSTSIDKVRYDRREFNYTTFERRFFLGDEIDQEKITASNLHGVLTITLVKDKSKEEKKTIAVQ